MMMNSGCILWKRRLQAVTSSFTIDVEAYAAMAVIREIVYLRDSLRHIGLPQATQAEQQKGTILYEDNEATTAIARTAAHREATKHMAMARSFLRYHQENGTVSFLDCYTSMQVADFLTKPLGPTSFRKLVDEAMGMEEQKDITKFAGRNWREQYDEQILKKQAERESKLGSSQSEIDASIDASIAQIDVSAISLSTDEVEDQQSGVFPDDTQGGMLKYGCLDLVYCNCMRVPMKLDAPDSVVCSSIEDYIKSEQHRSSLLTQIMAEDMKEEHKYYGNVVMGDRVALMCMRL